MQRLTRGQRNVYGYPLSPLRVECERDSQHLTSTDYFNVGGAPARYLAFHAVRGTGQSERVRDRGEEIDRGQ